MDSPGPWNWLPWRVFIYSKFGVFGAGEVPRNHDFAGEKASASHPNGAFGWWNSPPIFSHTDPNLIALDPCGYQVEKVVETSKPLLGTYLSSLLSCIYTLYLVWFLLLTFYAHRLPKISAGNLAEINFTIFTGVCHGKSQVLMVHVW